MTQRTRLRVVIGGRFIRSVKKKKKADSSHQNWVGKHYISLMLTSFLLSDSTIVLRTKQNKHPEQASLYSVFDIYRDKNIIPVPLSSFSLYGSILFQRWHEKLFPPVYGILFKKHLYGRPHRLSQHIQMTISCTGNLRPQCNTTKHKQLKTKNKKQKDLEENIGAYLIALWMSNDFLRN